MMNEFSKSKYRDSFNEIGTSIHSTNYDDAEESAYVKEYKKSLQVSFQPLRAEQLFRMLAEGNGNVKKELSTYIQYIEVCLVMFLIKMCEL